MNYIMREIGILKWAFWTGIAVYFLFFLFMYVLKVRRNISWKCVPELLFCVYAAALLKTTGMLELNFSLSGIMNFNLLPFIGSSIVPALLNWLLFVPLGFLMPLVFPSSKWNGKKAAAIGGAVSFTIEILQLLGGRYAEIDDVLLNTLGTFSGCFIFIAISNFRKNRKKAVQYLTVLCGSLMVCFAVIYFMGDNSSGMPDGLSAVKDDIAEVNVYYGGEKRSADPESFVYNCFETQISNCGGHLLESRPVSESNIINDEDCYIEIIYRAPHTLQFENAKYFSIQDADRILYNADTNMLYWGNSGYGNYLDYTGLEEELISYREQILEGYGQLKMSIMEYFH